MPMGRACMTVAGSTYMQARVFVGVTCAAAGSGAPADGWEPAARAAQHEAASSPAWASEGGGDCDAWLAPPRLGSCLSAGRCRVCQRSRAGSCEAHSTCGSAVQGSMQTGGQIKIYDSGFRV